MDRDPKQVDITRDPIYLLQELRRYWYNTPLGCEWDENSLCVKDPTELDSWLPPFVDEESQTIDLSQAFYTMAKDHESDWFFEWWDTVSVFLTRPEAEEWARRRAYRWEKWRVYCIPCDGDLAQILYDLPEPANRVPRQHPLTTLWQLPWRLLSGYVNWFRRRS